MKKTLRMISLLLVLSTLITTAIGCGSSGNTSTTATTSTKAPVTTTKPSNGSTPGTQPSESTAKPLEHKHTLEWKFDEEGHWQECSANDCSEKTNGSTHTLGKGVSATDGRFVTYTQTCSVCGYQKIEKGASEVTLTFDDMVDAIYEGAITLALIDSSFRENGTHYFQRLLKNGTNTIKVKAYEATTVSFVVTSLCAAGNRGKYTQIYKKLHVNGSSDGVTYTTGSPKFSGWDIPDDLTVATLALREGINEITFEMGADVNIAGIRFTNLTTPVLVTANAAATIAPKQALRGEGTETSPWLIETAEDLIAMNAWMKYDAAYAKGYYKMTADIDLDGKTFSGITASVGFSGTFDGDGHVVKNLFSEKILRNNNGFFGKVIGGTIQNLGVASGSIEGNCYVGGLIGYAENATILNCFNEASVKGHNQVGGIVGASVNTTVSNSFNAGKIRLSGRDSVGGIIGHANRSKLYNCYNIGTVAHGTDAGKLIGWANTAVRFENAFYDKTAAPENQPVGTLLSLKGMIGMTAEELTSQAFVDTLNQNLKDGYMSWSYGKDKIARLSKFEENAKISVFIASIDGVAIKDGRIETLVSEDGGYKTVIYGSNKQSVVNLDGTVYQPLTSQKVLLILDIAEVATGKVVARVERNIEVTVEGKYSTSGTNEVPNVIPGLREWYGLSGNFTVTENTRIVYTTEALEELANRVKTYLSDMLGITLETVQGSAKAGDILLKLTLDKAGEFGKEGYAVAIDEQVVIEASTETGLFYGAVTIMQILHQDENKCNVPKGYIRDYPAYEMRGGMIDVARKFFSIDYIEEIGKYMSWFKLNTLHLHINDDGGEREASFVVESKKYPQLNKNMGENVWSQDDYRAMQKELKKFGVNVITEIDTPGHSKSLALIDSSLVSGNSLKLNTQYDKCLSLVKSIYDEFFDGDDPVFQNAIVHIGTDEAGNASKEDMRRYISDLSQYVLSKENVEKVVFWGNLTENYGATEINPENVAAQIWVGPQMRVSEALDYGFEVINSTSSTFYLVPNYNGSFGDKTYMMGYADAARLYDIWGGARDFTTYGYDNPSDWFGWGYFYDDYNILRGDPKVLGALFANWNDSGLGFDYDLLELYMGYFAAISEKCWYDEDNRFASGEEFKEAFNAVSNYAPYANPRYRVDSDGKIIASYDFEETEENTVKDSANGYHATVVNGRIETIDGNKALALSGNTSLKLPFNGVGYPYTATFKLYLDGTQSENAILFTCDECTFYLNYHNKGVAFESGIYVYGFNVQIPTDEWVEIKITSQSPRYVFDSSNITILSINGAEYTPTNLTNTKTPSRASIIGTQETFLGVKGYLDDLLISNQYQFDPVVDAFEFKGDGTKDSPYLIETANDLRMFSLLLNKGRYQSAHFKLTADIDMTNVSYTSVVEFKGTLDGGGHKITGLTISEESTTNVGLIALLTEGVIQNLGIESSTIIGNKYVGALAGRTMNSKILNCYSKATVIGVDDTGGLVGMLNSTQVMNCYSMATVTGTTSVGGISGSFNTSLNQSNPASYDNVYSVANVSGTNYVGIFAGWDEGLRGMNVPATNIYLCSDQPVSGNYPDRTGTKLTGEQMTDGTLLSRLNSGRKDGYAAWTAGTDGYPTFAD